jgi:CBS domain containing-hemolysin-like protein
MPIMPKATAAAKPTHSGISFSPALLPFLLISSPKIRFLSMSWETLGMSDRVSAHASTPEESRIEAVMIYIWERARREERSARAVVRVN